MAAVGAFKYLKKNSRNGNKVKLLSACMAAITGVHTVEAVSNESILCWIYKEILNEN